MTDGEPTEMRAWLKKCVSLILLSVVGTLFCISGKDALCASDKNEEVDKFLKEFVVKREKLLDYSSRFTQIKVSSLFDEKEVSTGTVYYLRPGMILWDYRSPDVMKVLVKERVVSIYIEELEQLEIYDFSEEKRMRGLFLGFDESPEELKQLYNITLVDPGKSEKEICVKLVPRTEDLLSYFVSVQLWLRPKDFAIYKILIIDPEEEGQTSIELSRIKVNRGVRASVFEIKVPEGTEVIRYRVGEEEFGGETLSPGEAR